MPELEDMKGRFARLEEMEGDLATELERVHEKMRNLFEQILMKEEEKDRKRRTADHGDLHDER
jgi:hypothetical protein